MRQVPILQQRLHSFSRRIVLGLALLAAALACWPAAAAEGTTIAVLNVEVVLRQSKAGQDLVKQIAEIRAANQATDRKAEEALRQADQELRGQRAVLSAEAYAKKRDELQAQLAELQQAFDQRRKRFQVALEDAWNEIRAVLIEVTADLATEREIDVVVSEAAAALISKDLDISKDVLARLDEKITKATLNFEN